MTSMTSRSFAKLLAEWQGGVKLEPGKPFVRHLTGDQLKVIFGYIPAAVSMENLLITCQKVKDDLYKLVIKTT
jgi:hypothetical protein